jgi:glutathione-regulated potassium-efflux system ancillary protein KefC
VGGRASVSVSIFQDISVIPLMLLLAFLQPDAAERGLDWRAAALALAAIALVIVLGRLLLRPALRFIANTRLREVFVAFSLLLVIGIAALMVEIGLSMAFGAFLAGVLLADSEYRHELELDIEPFKGLLLGLFFIAVGMSVDLSLFLREPLLVFGLAAAVVALKALLVYPVAIAFGYRARTDALVLALAIAQVGEFAFILFGAAGALLPGETRDLLNAVVAVTMLSAPLVMLGYDRLLAPRLSGRAPPEADRIDERNPVIVAGFGRFGQVLARVLAGLKIRTTLIDHDPNQVELVRRFGNKAYYGDATRMDVLESAGIAGARLLVLALDDPEATRRLAERVRARYPDLKLVVRAHGRSDAFEYAEMGVPAVRETFGSALIAAEAALRALDFGPLAARRVVSKFRRVDEEALVEQAAHREDVKKLISLTQQGREDLERLLNEEALR